MLIFLSFVTTAPASENNEQPNNKQVLVISTHYSPPWSFDDCTGAEIDVIKLAFKEVGISVVCSFSSYARLVQNFVDLKVQFASPVIKMEGDQVGAFYSANFVPYVDVIASFENKTITLEDLADSKIVAYQKAQQYLGSDFLKATQTATIYRELPGRDEQIKMLARKRVDYIVGEKNILNTLANQLFPDKKLYINLVLQKWDIRASSHQKATMDKFNQGLLAIRKKGLIQKTFERYGVIK